MGLSNSKRAVCSGSILATALAVGVPAASAAPPAGLVCAKAPSYPYNVISGADFPGRTATVWTFPPGDIKTNPCGT